MGKLFSKTTVDDELIPMPLDVENRDNLRSDIEIFHDTSIQSTVRSGRRVLFSSAFVMTIGVTGILGGVIYFVKHRAHVFNNQTDVYFEIKALDPKGHPIAAAKVSVGEKQFGFTDSFGEWRHFLRLRLGSSVPLRISKNQGNLGLEITKNLVIPINVPPKGEVEIRHTVQLRSMREPAEQNVQPAITTVEQPLANSKVEKVEDVEASVPAVTPTNRVHVAVAAALMNAKTNPTGFERQRFLTTQVVPALKQKLIKSGVAMDADSEWIVRLAHVSAGQGESLIMVESFDKKNPATTNRFLRNYVSNPELIAEQISTILDKQRTQPNIAMSAPREGLTLHKLRLLGPVPGGAEVFVLGFAAISQADGSYRFWAKSGQDANLTVIHSGKVMLRTKVLAQAGRIAAVPMKMQSVARR